MDNIKMDDIRKEEWFHESCKRHGANPDKVIYEPEWGCLCEIQVDENGNEIKIPFFS